MNGKYTYITVIVLLGKLMFNRLGKIFIAVGIGLFIVHIMDWL